MAYVLSRLASLDVIHIYAEGVSSFGILHSENYSYGLFEQFKKLSENPTLYRERLELSPPVRACPYEAHVILYVVNKGNDIEIIRVRHGREDWL